MRRAIFSFAILLICSLVDISAQERDSVTFADASWSIRGISDGLTLQQFHFTDSSLFHSNQNISILKVDPRIVKTDIVGDTILRTVSSFSEEYNALAAVNGSFFDMRSRGIPYNTVTYLRVDYDVKSGDLPIGNNTEKRYHSGSIATRNGIPYILKADVLKDWEKLIEAEDVLTSGPLLIIDGKDEVLEEVSFNVKRHPRTAVGIDEDGYLYLVVVDGRNEQAAGMSLYELTKVMRWIGSISALNLDGGGSSAMYVQSDNESERIVSRPSDNGKFDNRGERRVANVVILR